MKDQLLDFLEDEQGMAAEFALVLPLLLIFVVGTLDVGLYAWNINQAEKSTQTGARFAAVTTPLVDEITTTSYVGDTINGNFIAQGDRIPKDAMGVLTCTSTGCTCTTAPCPGTTFNAVAFGNLRDRMQDIYPAIRDTNIEVVYNGSGLGYAGDPYQPEIAPLVTVRLTSMTYQPITFVLFGGTIGLPDFAYTITAEDSNGTQSN